MWNGSIFLTLIEVCLAFTIIITTYFKWRFTYWKKRNVPFLQPNFPFGNIPNPLKTKDTIGVVVKKHYDEFKIQKKRHGGLYFFSNPVYLVTDIEYVKNILTKDFQTWTDRGIYFNEKDDHLTAHLFALGGSRWRNLRVKLSPTFTSGKMKMMFQTLLDCEENLQEKIENLSKNREAIDIKEVLGCFTTDIIGSCAFGLECNTFKSEDSSFRKYGKKMFSQTRYDRLKFTFANNFPELAKALKIVITPDDLTEFFSNVVKDNVEYREKNNVTRNDFMQLLIDLKNNNIGGNSLTLKEVAAQCFVFFAAGFETSSTTMTFALYELAKNHYIQEKVRREVNSVLGKYDGKVCYDAIQEMKYMNQVINETLRKYPPVPSITRECINDYKIPDQDVILEKGTKAMISILGIHYDEEYYPDPYKFDPERFNEENSRSRHQYSHIPFGEGPRICIGLRFGLMQTKVGLTSLLRKYKFTVNKRTKEPIEFLSHSFILTAVGDIWLNAEKL